MRTRFGGPVEGRRSAKSTSQMNYDRCSLKELTKFAADRGLNVNPSSAAKNGKHASPLKRDYVEALQQADSCRTFRFLDLPPEMKNLIYEELLVLQDSYTCFPEILGTCRQIFKEGSNILYGDNEIGITLLPLRSVVHGKEYEGIENHPATFDWPEWINRVQHLRVSFERITTDAPTAAYLPRLLGPVVLEYEGHHEQSTWRDAAVLATAIVNSKTGATLFQGHSPLLESRINTAWAKLVRLIDVCRLNLDENHIMAPAPNDVIRKFMRIAKNREIDLGDNVVGEFMNTIDKHALDLWQKREITYELVPIVRLGRLCLRSAHIDQLELLEDVVATAMTDFTLAQIDVAAMDAEVIREGVRGREKYARPWAFPVADE
ncbi:unnamed protein product [Zymoseptoria tritici ST99CH_1A5]|uniref:Uncharacterized protein n=1 Tax=Zymoseptoria tritici ST99CH_1A5 TaxID=1276529 RepID=A0A1Y6LK39_ZYMTR|nr:unnamed protein product [Zymoseptoria tritici ST99CH_1A5]